MTAAKDQIFAAVLKRMDAPNIDWEEVAEECSYKDGKNAKTMFMRFKKQLLDHTENGSSGPEAGVQKSAGSPRGKKPGGPRSPKKKTSDGDEEDDATGSPKATPKRSRAKKASISTKNGTESSSGAAFAGGATVKNGSVSSGGDADAEDTEDTKMSEDIKSSTKNVKNEPEDEAI